MAPHLMDFLTPEAASQICMNECRAGCCRGYLTLAMTEEEVATFKSNGERLGIEAKITPTSDGGGWLRFPDHPGAHCPMLDDATSVCRIYDDRPQRCRDFPPKELAGCAISGG